jgi:hypothetical protein
MGDPPLDGVPRRNVAKASPLLASEVVLLASELVKSAALLNVK